MADGAASITKAKQTVWTASQDNMKVLDDGSEVDLERVIAVIKILLTRQTEAIKNPTK